MQQQGNPQFQQFQPGQGQQYSPQFFSQGQESGSGPQFQQPGGFPVGINPYQQSFGGQGGGFPSASGGPGRGFPRPQGGPGGRPLHRQQLPQAFSGAGSGSQGIPVGPAAFGRGVVKGESSEKGEKST